MRLVHPDLSFGIEWSAGLVQVLVIEDPPFFRKLISELISQVSGEDGKYVLSENWTSIHISKAVYVLSDVFQFTVNDRKNISQLHKYLAEIAVEKDMMPKHFGIERQIIEWADQLLQETPLPIVYESNIDTMNFFKTIDVKFDTHNCDTLNSIDLLFRIHSFFFQTKLIVLINPHHFFSPSEIDAIYASAHYRHLSLLCIENKVSIEKLNNERWMILDKDHCLTYNQNECEFPS